jgi:Spy/CpxP family protein refolding chaperone
VVSPWKVILATMVIFTCGVMTGAMVTRTAHAPQAAAVPANPHPPAAPVFQVQRAEFLKRLESQLDLAPEQRDQIARIMKESQERTGRLWEQIAPQMGDELKGAREEIRRVLTPEQRKQFAELMKHNRKADSGPPGGHPARSLESTNAATNVP